MHSRIVTYISSLILLVFLCSIACAISMPTSNEISKSVVFMLDASNSMNGNDRNRLAIDSIAQLIYSLPSNYKVGFVAYNTELIAEAPLVDSMQRDTIMDAAQTVRYTGYTNAGSGLSRALELLNEAPAEEKSVVILSDGEIVLENEKRTTESSAQFMDAVAQAQENGIQIHVIGLGDDMLDRQLAEQISMPRKPQIFKVQ